MQSFWNERYAAPEYAYGKAPNVFLASRLPDFPAGRILFPAEGEGRNAVFAARLGWEAHAFDYSESARMKALQLAQEQGVQLQYAVADVRELDYEPAAFDAIAIIFAHFPSSFRAHCHQVWDRLLKPGGVLLLEAFSKDHLSYNADGKAGGPREADLLYDAAELEAAFGHYDILESRQVETELSEGLYHNGLSSVVQFVARKPVNGPAFGQ
ncbi:MAG: class I SAM-dependent methyltransferase [Saprospiraceae bacterium]|nr:class I SAM-dependent methyltransferase [Saprospiraceae bacterium]HRD81224.1 class I SAM-dependent methyltransferase [Saprospiraceae bacterium]HRF38434.1 class I SAM-dependent methyltransferase [Saprospiraceae bacterium]HRJ16027.1 class I SAM-dependent methyltransferase [Saprospiraceae bacterium]HRK83438.1 class I SAM-dependent methyltransferase [Saprospiraceae bacterium]